MAVNTSVNPRLYGRRKRREAERAGETVSRRDKALQDVGGVVDKKDRSAMADLPASPARDFPGARTASRRATEEAAGRGYDIPTARLAETAGTGQIDQPRLGTVPSVAADVQSAERAKREAWYNQQAEELRAQGVPEDEITQLIGRQRPLTSEETELPLDTTVSSEGRVGLETEEDYRLREQMKAETEQTPLMTGDMLGDMADIGTDHLNDEETLAVMNDFKGFGSKQRALKYHAEFGAGDVQIAKQRAKDVVLGSDTTVLRREKKEGEDQTFVMSSGFPLLEEGLNRAGTSLNDDFTLNLVTTVMGMADAYMTWSQQEAFNKNEIANEEMTKARIKRGEEEGNPQEGGLLVNNGYTFDQLAGIYGQAFSALERNGLGLPKDMRQAIIDEMANSWLVEGIGSKNIKQTKIGDNIRYFIPTNSGPKVAMGEVVAGMVPGSVGSNVRALRGVIPPTHTNVGQSIEEKPGQTGTRQSVRKGSQGQAKQAMSNHAAIHYDVNVGAATVINSGFVAMDANKNGPKLGQWDNMRGWAQVSQEDIANYAADQVRLFNLPPEAASKIVEQVGFMEGIVYHPDARVADRIGMSFEAILKKAMSRSEELDGLSAAIAEAEDEKAAATSMQEMAIADEKAANARERVRQWVESFNNSTLQDFKKSNRDNYLTMADGSDPNGGEGTLTYMDKNPHSFLGITFYQATTNNRTAPSSRDADFVQNKTTHRDTTTFKNKPLSAWNFNEDMDVRETRLRGFVTNKRKTGLFDTKDPKEYKKRLYALPEQVRTEISWRIALGKQWLDEQGSKAGTLTDMTGRDITFENAKLIQLYDYFRIFDANTRADGSNKIIEEMANRGRQYADMLASADPETQSIDINGPHGEVLAELLKKSNAGKIGNLMSLAQDALAYQELMARDKGTRTGMVFNTTAQFDGVQSGPSIQALLTGDMDFLKRGGVYGRNQEGDVRAKYLETPRIAKALETTFSGERWNSPEAKVWSEVFNDFNQKRGAFDTTTTEGKKNWKAMEEWYAKIPLMQVYYGKDPSMMYDVAFEMLNQIPGIRFKVGTGYDGLNENSMYDMVDDLAEIMRVNLTSVVGGSYAGPMKAASRYLSVLNSSLLFDGRFTPSGDPWYLGKDHFHYQYDEDSYQEEVTEYFDKDGQLINKVARRMPLNNSAIYANDTKIVVERDAKTGTRKRTRTRAFLGKGVTSAVPVTLIHSLDNFLVNLTTNTVNAERRKHAPEGTEPMPANVMWVYDAAIVDMGSLLEVIPTYNNEAVPSLMKWNVFEQMGNFVKEKEKAEINRVNRSGGANASVIPKREGLADPELMERLEKFQREHGDILHQGQVPLTSGTEKSYAGITGALDEIWYYRPPETWKEAEEQGFYKTHKEWEMAKRQSDKFWREINKIKRSGDLYDTSYRTTVRESMEAVKSPHPLRRSYKDVPVYLPPEQVNVFARKNMLYTPEQFAQMLSLIRDHLRLFDPSFDQSASTEYQSRSKGSLKWAANRSRNNLDTARSLMRDTGINVTQLSG